MIYEYMHTVDMLIFTEDMKELLLVQRKNDPYKGCWAIPGGFVEPDESLEAAAERELKEETDVEGITLRQLYTFGAVERDPRGRVISTAYVAYVDKAQLHVKAGDDAAKAEWFSVTMVQGKLMVCNQHGLPVTLAFDHADIITMALEQK